MADCSIRFDDSSMSRYHCMVSFDNTWHIKDGDGFKPSTNGTWLFAEDFIELHDNMVFKAAETLFKVFLM
jgi:pSer/pThr/pTyr-binding forkhead associated (FHA) protein